MNEINKTCQIEVYGVVFNGIEDIGRHAFNHEPKDGVFVGVDCKRYPCLDNYDSHFENRYFCNFVFAHSQEEVDQKLATLEHLPDSKNYNKLTYSLAPMIYWGGDFDSPMVIINAQENIDKETAQTPSIKEVERESIFSRFRHKVVDLISDNADYIYE